VLDVLVMWHWFHANWKQEEHIKFVFI
jgi:hypothetical protein